VCPATGCRRSFKIVADESGSRLRSAVTATSDNEVGLFHVSGPSRRADTRPLWEDAPKSVGSRSREHGLFRVSRGGGGETSTKIPWATLKRHGRCQPQKLGRGGRRREALWCGFMTPGRSPTISVDGPPPQIRVFGLRPVDGLGRKAVSSALQFRIHGTGRSGAATEGGLSRLKEGRVATLSGQERIGLRCGGWVD
jgi:hypothetical protein